MAAPLNPPRSEGEEGEEGRKEEGRKDVLRKRAEEEGEGGITPARMPPA